MNLLGIINSLSHSSSVIRIQRKFHLLVGRAKKRINQVNSLHFAYQARRGTCVLTLILDPEYSWELY